MINASDLRVGNWVLYESSMGKNKLRITEISEKDICKDLFPIPLTEEILVKCGLKKEKASNYGGADSWQGMGAYSYNGDRLFRGDCNGLKLVGYFNTNFEYLHQIQNIMYFLYGKELEVNL